MSEYQNRLDRAVIGGRDRVRAGARRRGDDLSRLVRATAAVADANSEDELIRIMLEKTADLDIPWCGLFEWDGDRFRCRAEAGGAAAISGAEVVRADAGAPVLDTLPPHTFTFTSAGFRPTATTSLLLPRPSGAAALLLVADDQRTPEELRTLAPLLQEIVTIGRLRLEQLWLQAQLASMQHELDTRVAERTEELERANRALAEEIAERRRTKIAMRQAAAVFANTTEGVLITDAGEKILWVNRAFSDITGYEADEVLGRTPRLLRSGRHPAAFYSAMWRSIRDNGHWKGEIWNRRKDGTVYPELLNVTAVKNEGGDTTHYVALFSDISANRDSQHRLDHLAHYDPLTELPNRLLFRARLDHAAEQAKRHGGKIGVFILGVDGFKALNQTLGLPAGDEVLREVARVLSQTAREGDTVARLAGDEFVILLENLESAQAAGSIALKTLATVARNFEIEGRELFLTCSGGMSVYPDDGEDLGALLRNAHTAFHRAKESGRNSYQFYTSDMRVHVDERFLIESDLRRAVQREELTLYFQPQFSVRTGECVGFEALSRWKHPDRGLLLPKSFIPIAEETGIINAIDGWAIKEACRHAIRWQETAAAPLRVAVNLSAREITRTDLAQTVEEALVESGLCPELLEIEITEGSLLQHPEEAFRTLRALKDLGITLAIDDFGTGYSSLSYLKLLPVDKLKIDQSFVRDINIHPDDAAIARTIITLAHGLHLKVLAEGVENEEQAAFLRENGCDEVQGFHFGRPVRAAEVEAFLRGRTS